MDQSKPTPPPEPSRILEINLISAQGLKIPPSAKTHRMHTYAIAYIDPSTKLRSTLDRIGGENPTWNEKFIFRVSPRFIYGDTSAVQFQIFACGYIRDYLIGNVRFLLSSSSLTSSKSGAVIGTPAFSALHIRRPSGRVHGVLNIAATVYESSDFASFETSGMSAVCFRDLFGEKECEEKRRRESRRMSWHPRLIRGGSKKSEVSVEGDVSDGNESTTTSTTSSSSSSLTAFKDLNSEVAGKKGLLCGLLLSRRFSFCPSDQNILALTGFQEKQI